MYRQVFQVPYFGHFEPSLDALKLRSDVTRSIEILPLADGVCLGGTVTRLRHPPASHNAARSVPGNRAH